MYTYGQDGNKQPVTQNGVQENYNSRRVVENYGSDKKERRTWLWILLIVVAVALIVGLLMMKKKSSSSSAESYQAPASASFGMGDKSWGFKEVSGGFRFY